MDWKIYRVRHDVMMTVKNEFNGAVGAVIVETPSANLPWLTVSSLNFLVVYINHDEHDSDIEYAHGDISSADFVSLIQPRGVLAR